MKDNQKIYIRGDKDRGNEIRDILIGLGATAYASCDNDQYLYFINHNNGIGAALIDSEVGDIIMDNYKEIELPRRQWKEGDALVNNKFSDCYAVFKKYNNDGTFEAYFILDQKTAHFDAAAFVEAFHLASAEEIEALPRLFSLLMGKLNEAGLCMPKKV